MSDDCDNYDPDYYDKEFRDANPGVYGYDEYAQQFYPPTRQTVRRTASSGRKVRKSNRSYVHEPKDKEKEKSERMQNLILYALLLLFVVAAYFFLLMVTE